jgi:hypothetical protein
LPSIKLILGSFLFRSDILVEQSFGSRFSFGPVLPSDRVCLSFVLVYQRMARQRKSRPCDAISHVIWLLRYTSLPWYQGEVRFVHHIYPIPGKNTSARFASPIQVFLCSGISPIYLKKTKWFWVPLTVCFALSFLPISSSRTARTQMVLHFAPSKCCIDQPTPRCSAPPSIRDPLHHRRENDKNWHISDDVVRELPL